MRFLWWVLMLALAGGTASLAQPADPAAADTLEGELPEIEIQAARGTVTEADAPLAVTVLDRTPEAVAQEPALSLASVLGAVPGLYVADRGHFALGERITARGAGWRSAFGVRGVQVFLDGIPLTLPDGQAMPDIIDPAFVRRAEVVRGPASIFWGNAGGGALFLSTDPRTATPFVRARALGGTYGALHLGAEAGGSLGRHSVRGYASHQATDGYRAYSAGSFTRGGLFATVDRGPRQQLKLVGAFAVQDTEHPGSLTAEQVDDDRRQADSRYVATASGKESVQVQAGATLLQAFERGLLTATAYGLARDLQNPLPFAYIDLARQAGGLRATLQTEELSMRWALGADLGAQRDRRFNFDNVDGAPGSERSLDQVEQVQTAAAFVTVTDDVILDRLSLTGGLRATYVGFQAEDRLLDDGDDSGDRSFAAWTGTIGVVYRWRGASLFANYGGAFETPTTTELVNNPAGEGGFNLDLEPQETNGIEVGLRGAVGRLNLGYDVTYFFMNVLDGLSPFQIEGVPGRTFYRNAGEVSHNGVEAVLTWIPHPDLRAEASYTWTRVVNHGLPGAPRLPGIPPHRLYAQAVATPGPLRLAAIVHTLDAAYTDDQNTAQVDGYTVLDLQAGATLRLAGTRVQPFAAVSNALGATYVGSLVVNARGGRFFEPAAGRAVQLGVNVWL